MEYCFVVRVIELEHVAEVTVAERCDVSGHGRSAGECCRAIPLQDVVERVRQRFDNSEKRSLT